MRIALDLQACQTASRHRGIGRYSLDLTRALLAEAPGELLLGLDGTYPSEAEEVVESLRDLTPRAALSRYYYPGPVHAHGHPSDVYRPASDVLVRSHYRRLSPDVVHVHSLFEGFVDHAGGMSGVPSLEGTLSSVTLYDFIPLVYSARYLTNAEYKTWYLKRLAVLQRFDLLLCISEATRADAIRFLGIPPERLAVIHAGVGAEFLPRAWMPDERAVFLRRFGIRGRFVLYTGNGDFRKNLAGAIEAFSKLPQEVRDGVQLVLNQVDDEAGLRILAARFGLADQDMVITGKVSNQDLIGLFQTCDVFFFPSLYEGFGLPVLEAMACGAPTICGDNSSLREVMRRNDAMFDASSPEAAAGLLTHALLDEGMRASLRESGLARAKEYSWARTARLTGEAWHEAHARTHASMRSALVRPPRKRVAMVTPLPPERTGVASYVSEILAPLSRYVDLDLYTSAELSSAQTTNAHVRVSPWTQLPAMAAHYDCIIYQFGNSPFHSHMVGLLERFPGIVVLHDVYLSSMFWHMDEHEGEAGAFSKALLHSHGREAVVCLRQEGALEARRRYPASLSVLEAATAVIVHSQHSLRTIRDQFPYARGGRVRVAPMPIRSEGRASHAERRSARERLGIADSDCLIVSFGFIADTKLSITILDALARLKEGHPGLKMVFVGENDGGSYGQDVLQRIQTLGGAISVSITGFADDDVYSDYLIASDIAVQLRAGSRGETSKAVYDCMSHGLPTVVNDYASLGELPDGYVRKISSIPDAEELSAALGALIVDAELRNVLGAAAVEFMRSVHAPDATARVYADTLEEAIAARRARSGDDLVNGLSRVLEGRSLLDGEASALEYAIARDRRDSPTPRVLLDLSEVTHTDYATGVHRVVRNLAREMLLRESPTVLRLAAVAHEKGGALVSAEAYVESALGIPGRGEDGVNFAAGDLLFLLDSAWEMPDRFDRSLAKLADAGGRVAAFVHDLIPLRHPEFCVDYMPGVYEKWLRYVVANCDVLVCNSLATANDLRAWIGETGASRKSAQRIGHVHLGADLVEDGCLDDASDRIREAIAGRAVLMVGTVEPRKGHAHVLEAFEAAWKAGTDISWVIVGKQGWNVESLAETLRRHPQAGKRLFWLEDANDADLRYGYSHAHAALQASFAEGFGLPIVEAAHYGCPLILSDIPVFREIAGEHAAYYPAGDARALAARLAAPPPARPQVLAQSWRDSAAGVISLLMADGRRGA
jgi:glycosyltransferase involved in cell wall biosynthesis